ncbi:hypothetical protein M9979_00765 [Sphingomonas sp. RP10(2022)]|uniref:Uncharacterized protein n=1 Tax=Sphingomonas liriopis TaxID=2949094 RepID=A0A9X2HSC9_9SPHN|nr:hypothetical protein [Sphingomonas liriopis]MCP3733416.1 hypothetical protein [Sphingomonas liriopis]
MADELNVPSEGRSMAAQSDPGVVSIADGHVMLDGPDGVAVTMTPYAAAETGRRLIAGAERALAQT